MIKLWHFINNNDISSKEQFTACKALGVNTCIININGKSTNYMRITTNTDTTVDTANNSEICKYNRNNPKKRTCGYASIAPEGEYWISDNLGAPTEAEAKDMTGSVCSVADCVSRGDYYEAAKRRCQNSGGHLANLAELEIARQNGKLKNGSFWAAEEQYWHYSYVMKSDGNVYGDAKHHLTAQVICAGN